MPIALVSAGWLTDHITVIVVAVGVAIAVVKRDTLLAIIALQAGDSLRHWAAGVIRSRKALAKVASRTDDEHVRMIAVQKLQAQGVPDSLAMWVDEKATRNIGDQGLLAKIALAGWDESVRLAAVDNLTDQDALAELWTGGGFSVARCEHFFGLGDRALMRITDQHKLFKLALEMPLTAYNYEEKRDRFERVVARLTDQALLGRIALEKEGGSDVVLKNLSDQSVLGKLACQSEKPYVRCLATQKVGDQALLATLAIQDGDCEVRCTAVGALTDESALARVAVDGRHQDACIAAAGKLTDQALMAKVVSEAPDALVRALALESLSDEGVLRGQANSVSPLIRTVVQARLGDPEQQLNLGNTYAEGRVLPRDERRARTWYERSAAGGNVRAMNNLGGMYMRHLEYGRALEWFLEAAKQGSAAAQANIGVMYYLGKGVPKDMAKAIEFCQKAAAQGNGPAQFHLGMMFRDGNGVRSDRAMAEKWFMEASRQGIEEATKALRRL